MSENNNNVQVSLYKRKWLFRIPFTEFGLKSPWKSRVKAEDMLENSPVMLYITEEGEIKMHYNVKTGRHVPKDKYGRSKEGENLIESRKLLQWNYDGMKVPTYIHYEKEVYGYPHEPKLDAKSITKTLRTIQLSYKEYEQKSDFWNKFFGDVNVTAILKLVGGLVGIVIGAIYLMNMFNIHPLETLGLGKEAVKQGSQAIINNPPPITELP